MAEGCLALAEVRWLTFFAYGRPLAWEFCTGESRMSLGCPIAFGRRCFENWHMQARLPLALALTQTFGSDKIHLIMRWT